ncbi:hypothetical protein ACTA71_002840 [Dictyostelium dimigraforme]
MNELIIPFFITGSINLVWLKLNKFIRFKNYLSGEIARKFMHIGTGIIFLSTWNLFPQFNDNSKYVAGIFPLLSTIQFIVVGVGLIKDKELVNVVCRSESCSDLLYGPVCYGSIITFLTMFYWVNYISIISICVLCFGDGFAAIIGKQFGKIKLPYNENKSIIGSISFFIFSFIGSLIFLKLFESKLGNLNSQYILVVCLVSALVESLPLKEYDNLSIPISSILILKLFGL